MSSRFPKFDIAHNYNTIDLNEKTKYNLLRQNGLKISKIFAQIKTASAFSKSLITLTLFKIQSFIERIRQKLLFQIFFVICNNPITIPPVFIRIHISGKYFSSKTHSAPNIQQLVIPLDLYQDKVLCSFFIKEM